MISVRSALLVAQAVIPWIGASAFAQAPDPKDTPAVLESEIATTAVLRPLQDRDLLASRYDGGVRIIDGESLGTLGQFYASGYANFAIAPDNKFFYVAETYWSRGNRGKREDLLSVYDAKTLNLVAEIPLPGRLISDPSTRSFDLSPDGRYAYVYNFEPASSVIVVDLVKRAVSTTVEIPGCGLVFPWGERGFASLCSDGSMAIANADARGRYKVTRTSKFFDVDNDPIFDESLVDRRAGEAIFISYTGLVYQVKLGETPEIGEPWSIQKAAGLPPATTKTGHVTWRPCGRRLATYHRESGRLFLLMHESTHWDYGQDGTEIWVLDVKERTLVTRMTLPQSASTIVVTQDAEPSLFAFGAGWLWDLDPKTGDVRRAKRVGPVGLVGVKGF